MVENNEVVHDEVFAANAVDDLESSMATLQDAVLALRVVANLACDANAIRAVHDVRKCASTIAVALDEWLEWKP